VLERCCSGFGITFNGEDPCENESATETDVVTALIVVYS
jgi:hypothetical protein